MHDKPSDSEQETELQIDTSRMSEGTRQALAVAEAGMARRPRVFARAREARARVWMLESRRQLQIL